MSELLRIDLLRRLLRGAETVESLRGSAGREFDSVFAEARNRGEIVDGPIAISGTHTTATTVLSADVRDELARLQQEEGGASFLDPAKDDVGRRFLLAEEQELPTRAAGAARRLREEAARYRFERSAARELAKAVALTNSLIQTTLVGLLEREDEEAAASALSGRPLGQPPLGADVVAALVRETYAPLLTGRAREFAMACADAADAVHRLFAGRSDDPDETRRIAESLGSAFAGLVEGNLAAAADSFEALTAVEGVA